MIAHVYKPRRRNKAGRTEAGRIYRGRFRLKGEFAITEVSLETSDKQVAEKKLAELVSEKERERAGLLAPKLHRESAKKLLSLHVEEFIADLTTLGRSAIYRRLVNSRIRRLIRECGWKNVGDITVDHFTAWRSRQSKAAPKTLNDYLDAVSAFLNWMERQGRIAANPLTNVPPVDKRGKQGKRRAFSNEEFDRLLAVSGPHRLLYLTAAYTGLRLGELRQLVWGDLILGSDRPHMVVRAGTTKNRTEALVPIHPELLPELKAAKAPAVAASAPVFRGCNNADRVIQRHIAAAKIERVDAMGRALVFHSLRYTFATKLAVAGISQRLAQELMRHSDPRLTANLYTDVKRLPTFDAVYGLAWHADETSRPNPGLPPPQPPQLHPQELGARGLNGSQPDTMAHAEAAREDSDSDEVCAVLACPVPDLKMAEREGFEPPGPCGPAVFKTAAIDHSATSPVKGYESFDSRIGNRIDTLERLLRLSARECDTSTTRKCGALPALGNVEVRGRVGDRRQAHAG